MNTKREKLKQLWIDLSKNREATESYKIRNGKNINIGFVNQFSLHSFIPNKWFDWENSFDSEIMIVGQDWGPYSALLPYITEYEGQKKFKDFNYNKYLFCVKFYCVLLMISSIFIPKLANIASVPSL